MIHVSHCQRETAVHVLWPQCFEYYWLPPFLPDLDLVILNSFRLITFLLALLLSFRVNRTYDRWWQARQGFSGVGGAAVALSQQAVQWVQDPAIRVSGSCPKLSKVLRDDRPLISTC